MKKSLRVFIGFLAFMLVVCSFAYAADQATTQNATGPKYEGVLNVNTATIEELIMLPGIGEKTAQNIVEYCKVNGPFTLVNNLINVEGIGEKKLEQIKPYIVLEGKSTLRLVK